jgi:hypothetical protein
LGLIDTDAIGFCNRDMPARATIFGLPLALLVIASAALQLPGTVGLNIKVIGAPLPGLTVKGVPVMTPNAAVFEPVIAKFEITNAPVPELVTITVWVVAPV